MVGDLGQHSAEVEFGVEAVQLGRPDQAVYGGVTFATAIRTCKQVVFPVMQIFA